MRSDDADVWILNKRLISIYVVIDGWKYGIFTLYFCDVKSCYVLIKIIQISRANEAESVCVWERKKSVVKSILNAHTHTQTHP